VPRFVRPALRCVSPVRRLNVTLIVVAFVMSVFAGRLVQLQGLEYAKFSIAAAHTRHGQVTFPAVRGSITTSNGAILAMTVQTDTVTADPVEIPPRLRPSVAGKLAGPLGLPAGAILYKLNNPSSREYVVLAAGLAVATANHIDGLSLPGIGTTANYTRTYPNADLAANFVGFTRTDARGNLLGRAGLEEEYNSLLAGRDGQEEVELGTDGEPIPLSAQEVTPAVPARNLRLTINSDIQFAAEQECRERVLTFNALNCSIVVMDPRTGAILAMAQWPTYNPDNITSLPATTNISTANVFAPGSTLKSITVAAALEKGHQTPMSVYTVPYKIRIDNQFTFHDAEVHPTTRYTIAGILAHSLNVGMVQVVQHITPMQQYEYLRAFGLGSPSGLGMPGESAGLLPRPGTAGYWSDDPFEFSFGQGVSVTAVQMASVYATIANGGVRVQPTLVAGTTSSTGVYTPAPRSASRRVIQASTARELMTILQQVPVVDAQAGERWGLISGYSVAAKTGTAQVTDVPVSKCDLCQYGSSYIGIAPANDPQLVVAVNIQDPRGSHYFGDQVAGPAFYDVMRFALQAMKIPPDHARTPYIRLTAP
jgi:cell division protein FtsI (penicillin-binding protein 3)